MKVHSAPKITSIFLHFRPMQKSERFFSTNRLFFPFEKLRSLSLSRPLQVLCPTNKQASELALVLGSQNISYVTPKSLFVSPSFGEMEAENCSLSSQKISS